MKKYPFGFFEIIITLGIILFLLQYYWFSDMEHILYIPERRGGYDEIISVNQTWEPKGRHLRFSLPRKKHIYESPYTFLISIKKNNKEIDDLIIREVKLIFPGMDVISFTPDKSLEEWTKIQINSLEDIYTLEINNIQIDSKITSILVNISITTVNSMGIKQNKDITTRFNKNISARLIFPTT
jgi:hypothetical protein